MVEKGQLKHLLALLTHPERVYLLACCKQHKNYSGLKPLVYIDTDYRDLALKNDADPTITLPRLTQIRAALKDFVLLTSKGRPDGHGKDFAIMLKYDSHQIIETLTDDVYGFSLKVY